MTPPATIMIAAYNAARFLPKSLASAQAQGDFSPEIIVVDDASTDNTSDVMATIPGVRYIRMAVNGGPSVARNKAIDEAHGAWIAVLDADDAMTPDRLQKMMAHGEAVQADIVLGNFKRVDAAGADLEDGAFLPPGEIDPAHILSLEDYLSGNQMTEGEKCLGYLKPLFRRDFLIQSGLRYDPALRNSEDYHIIAQAIAAGARVIIAPEPDYLYRIADGSLSSKAPPAYLEKLIAADAAFARSLGADISPELSTLIGTRRDNLMLLLTSEKVMINLKNKRFGAAMRDMIKSRSVLLKVCHKLSEALTKRLPRPSAR